MSLLNCAALSLPLVFGLGCPAPPEAEGPPAGQHEPGGAPGGPGPGPAAAGPGEQGAPPNGAPAEGAAEGTAEGTAAGPPSTGDGAPAPGAETGPAEPVLGKGFKDLIGDGETVTISGTIVGESDVRLEFLTEFKQDGRLAPRNIHLQEVKGSSFSIVAPATHDGAIFVTAMKDKTGDGPSPDDSSGYADAPIKLAGEDVTVTITFDGTQPAWAEKLLAPPPDGGPPPPPPGTEGAPPPAEPE